MKRNNLLVKIILSKIENIQEEYLEYKDAEIFLKQDNVSNGIMAEIIMDSDYSPAVTDVYAHLKILEEAGYIINEYDDIMHIHKARLTWQGHDYLSQVHNKVDTH